MAGQISRQKSKSGFLFPHSYGKEAFDIRRARKNARNEAGIIDFCFLGIRHSAADNLSLNHASQLVLGALNAPDDDAALSPS